MSNGNGLVQHRESRGAQRPERQAEGDHEARDREPGGDRRGHADGERAAVADRQHGDRNHDGDGDDAGNDAEPGGRPGRRGQRFELFGQRLRARLVRVGDGPPRPLPERHNRHGQGETEDEEHERQGRRLPASERHRPVAPCRRPRALIEPATHASLDDDDGERHDDENRRRRE